MLELHKRKLQIFSNYMVNCFTLAEAVTMGKLYRCTESGEILTEAQLQAEFETLKAEEPETYDYNFAEVKTDFWKF